MPMKTKTKSGKPGSARKSAAGRSSGSKKGTSSRRKSSFAQIVAMLEDDHSKVDKLFKRYAKMKRDEDGARFRLAQQICAMLKVHAALEEELFYPQARDLLGDDDGLIDEAEVEHASCKQLIADLEQLEGSDPMYDAKVKVLGEYIEHHVEEEEGEMFPKLKKRAEDRIDGLFEQMEEMRRSLEADLGLESAMAGTKSVRPERGTAQLS